MRIIQDISLIVKVLQIMLLRIMLYLTTDIPICSQILNKNPTTTTTTPTTTIENRLLCGVHAFPLIQNVRLNCAKSQ
jgi:hypothetical protein